MLPAVRGKTLVQRIGQLLQLKTRRRLVHVHVSDAYKGDVAAHQLVQLVGGEGGDDPDKVALLVGERGEERKEQLLLPQLGGQEGGEGEQGEEE